MSGQRVGYIRVSSVGQNTERQLDGIVLDEVFTDKVSGKDTNRPALSNLLKHVRKGDVVVVHSMDRLARNVGDLRAIVDGLNSRGVNVEFIKESLTFSGADTAIAKLLLNVMGAFAEFERTLIKERQMEGIAIAKAKGKFKGRKRTFTAENIELIKTRVANNESKSAIAREFGISRVTLYNYLKS